MTSAQQTYQRMGLEQLRQRAIQTDDHDDDEAARAFVDRLLDLEVERRLVLLHERPGWHACSPGFGDGTGKGTAPTDSMYLAYIKGIRISPWHDTAKRAVSALPERQRLAVLIQAAKSDSRLNGPFAFKYQDIAENLGHFARLLGWPSFAPIPPDESVEWRINDDGKKERHEIKTPAFPNGQAIKRAAWQARAELILMSKAGVV